MWGNTWFQNLDDYALPIQGIDALINLRIFAPTDFLDNFIILLGPSHTLSMNLLTRI